MWEYIQWVSRLQFSHIQTRNFHIIFTLSLYRAYKRKDVRENKESWRNRILRNIKITMQIAENRLLIDNYKLRRTSVHPGALNISPDIMMLVMLTTPSFLKEPIDFNCIISMILANWIPHTRTWSTLRQRSAFLKDFRSCGIAIRMIFLYVFVLMSLALGSASSLNVDDVIVRFIVNATPILFPPLRTSLQLCIGYGKIFRTLLFIYVRRIKNILSLSRSQKKCNWNNTVFSLFFSTDDTIKLSRILSSYHVTHSIRNLHEDFDPRLYDNLEHRNLYVLDLDCDYAVDVLKQVTNCFTCASSKVWNKT